MVCDFPWSDEKSMLVNAKESLCIVLDLFFHYHHGKMILYSNICETYILFLKKHYSHICASNHLYLGLCMCVCPMCICVYFYVYGYRRVLFLTFCRSEGNLDVVPHFPLWTRVCLFTYVLITAATHTYTHARTHQTSWPMTRGGYS